MIVQFINSPEARYRFTTHISRVVVPPTQAEIDKAHRIAKVEKLKVICYDDSTGEILLDEDYRQKPSQRR